MEAPPWKGKGYRHSGELQFLPVQVWLGVMASALSPWLLFIIPSHHATQVKLTLSSKHLCVCVCVYVSHSVMSNSLRARELSPPSSSVHGILQARTLEWAAISSSRESSRPRDRTLVSYVSCIDRQVLYR